MTVTEKTRKKQSLRRDQKFQAMLKKADASHFDSTMLKEYADTFPQYASRAHLAQKIAKNERQVISKLVEEVFAYFPFEDIGYGREKCGRDIGLVSINITKSMLMDDVKWLEDSVLYWMKTMIHSFCFPKEKRNESSISLHVQDPVVEKIVIKSRSLPGHISPCYVTYSRMAVLYKAMLSDAEWSLVLPQFKSTIAILGSE